MKKILALLAILSTSTLALAQDDPGAASEGGGFVFDLLLYLTYFLVIGAGIAAVVLSILKSSGEKGTLVKSGIMVGGIIVLFIIAYAVAGNEVTETYKRFGIDAGDSKFVGGALITVYLLVILAFGGFVFSRVKDLLNL
ncbi:MAG: hypothetical protein ACFB0B_15570 [Thermonemataceae bacterium]